MLDLYHADDGRLAHGRGAEGRPETAAIPVLVLSVLDPDDGAGLADRVEKWLTKPIEDGDALIGAVEQLVGGTDAACRGCSSSRTTPTWRRSSPRRSSAAGLRVEVGVDGGRRRDASGARSSPT